MTQYERVIEAGDRSVGVCANLCKSSDYSFVQVLEARGVGSLIEVQQSWEKPLFLSGNISSEHEDPVLALTSAIRSVLGAEKLVVSVSLLSFDRTLIDKILGELRTFKRGHA